MFEYKSLKHLMQVWPELKADSVLNKKDHSIVSKAFSKSIKTRIPDVFFFGGAMHQIIDHPTIFTNVSALEVSYLV